MTPCGALDWYQCAYETCYLYLRWISTKTNAAGTYEMLFPLDGTQQHRIQGDHILELPVANLILYNKESSLVKYRIYDPTTMA